MFSEVWSVIITVRHGGMLTDWKSSQVSYILSCRKQKVIRETGQYLELLSIYEFSKLASIVIYFH